MTHLKLLSTIASRQMNLLFDAKRSEGMSSVERDRVVLILAQILMQAAGLNVATPMHPADASALAECAATLEQGITAGGDRAVAAAQRADLEQCGHGSRSRLMPRTSPRCRGRGRPRSPAHRAARWMARPRQ